MATNADPLRSLLVDASEVDRKEIAAALRDLIAIDGQSGRLVLLPDYSQLSAKGKVLAVLLARKAGHLLEVISTEPAANADVARESGLPSGTAAPALRDLLQMRLVAQDTSRAYYIPNTHLRQAIAALR